MNCSNCQRDMRLIRGDLRYTFLNTMQAMKLINCEYFHCKRCDTVGYPEETKAYIIKEIEETKGNGNIIIRFE